jgi:hypothetical protein
VLSLSSRFVCDVLSGVSMFVFLGLLVEEGVGLGFLRLFSERSCVLG